LASRYHKSIFFVFLITLNIITGCFFLTIYKSEDNNIFTSKIIHNISGNNFELDAPISPKLSDGQPNSLNSSNIWQNTSQVLRVYESIYFEVNISGFHDHGGNATVMQISFTNGSTLDYNMTRVGSTSNYTYTYTPEYYAPYGLQIVRFRVYNANTTNMNNWDLLNNLTFSAYTSFSILANCIANLNSTQYKRGEYFLADLVVLDYNNFDWKVSVVNSNDQTVFELEDKIFQINFQINDSFDQPNHYYYVQINLTRNSDGKWDLPLFRFKFVNTKPKISESTIDISPSAIYREKDFRITVNVSDEENQVSDLEVKLTLEDPDGGKETYTLNNILDTSQFRKSGISIDKDKPSGNYRMNLTAKDQQGGIDSYYDILEVHNNPPKINSYKVNNFTQDESVSINYGEDLIFTFNVSDIEGLKYVKVALLNEENEWYNMSDNYYGEDTKLRIRTVELITGIWYVYVYVTDKDGKTVGLDFDFDTAPQEIMIIPDTLSQWLPWISFFIGLGIGGAIGIAIGLARAKAKISKTTEVIPSKTKKKPRPIKKKPMKAQKSLKSSLEKIPAKTTEKEKIKPPKKEEAEREKPQRKIKRKL